MTRGDVVEGGANVSAAAPLTIRPGAGAEWVIHNIYHEAEVELYIIVGGIGLKFDDDTEKGSWSMCFFHLTNTHYLPVKNTNVAAKYISYDGIVSK